MAFDVRAYQRAYYATPRGKEVRARALKKFNDSDKGRAMRKAYQKTGKGRAAGKRWYMSWRGMLRAALKRVLDRHPKRWPDDPTTLTHTQLIELWQKQEGRCALSGVVMTWGQGEVKSTSVSLDRIDGRRGYHLDNIRFVCTAVNAFRSNGTDEQMIELAKAIVNHSHSLNNGVTA